MTKDTSTILNIGDEALDAPTQNAGPGGRGCCYICKVSDEALEAPTQNALPCTFYCRVSDETYATV